MWYSHLVNKELIKKLENILTIDGRGRPAKARMLLEILETVDMEEVRKNLKEIGERRFF